MTAHRRRLALWAPVFVYMAVIFAVSSMPRPPRVSDGVSDKVVHAAAYAGLSATVVRALSGGWGRPVTAAQALAAADVMDVMADGAGAALAAISLWAWGIIRRRHAL